MRPANHPHRIEARAPVIVLLLLVALILGACSGGDEDEADGGGGDGAVAANLGNDLEDACLIYTAADAAEALRAEVEPVTEFDFDLPKQFLRCEYAEVDGRRSTGILVERGMAVDQFMGDIERTEIFNEPEEIDGVADRAFWITGDLNTLFMLDGELEVTLRIGTNSLRTTGEALTALRDLNIEVGRTIIQRLRGEALGLVADVDADDASPTATARASSTAGASSATATAAPTPATPEPTAVALEPPDRSGDSFEDNLLAGVARGDWTLEAGLVETLALFAGERDASEVLSSSDLVYAEGTAILALAQEYLETGSNPPLRAEVERLLGLLTFSGDELDAMVVGATASNRADAPTLISNSVAATVEDCQRFYSAFVDEIADRAPEECLNVSVLTVGPSTFHVYVPALEEPATGWTDRHTALVLATINETVESTFLRLGKMPITVRIVLSAQVHPVALATAIAPPNTSSCVISLFKQSQALADGDFKQSLAHEFGHCFQDATLAAQRVSSAARGWREEGFAEYLSDVAYPSNDYERRIVDPFRNSEVMTATVQSRTYLNYMWFSFWSDQLGGDLALVELLRTGPTVDGKQAQQDFLASTGSIAATHHQFTEAVSDGAISNRDGGSWGPSSSLNGTVRLRDPQTYALSADFEPFGVAKWEFVIPRGSTVTTRIVEGAGVMASWRELDEPGGWIDLNPIERFVASCDGDLHGYLAVSSTEEPAVFALDVVDVEDGDCSDEPELPEIVGNDVCLVGTWAIDMTAFRRTAEERIVVDLNVVSVTGDILVTFLPNGDLESAIDELAFFYRTEWEGVADRLEVRLQWDGTGTGSWNADGTLVQIRTDDFDMKTTQFVRLDGDVIVGGSNPPGDDLFGATVGAPANGYQCTADTLEIEGVSIGSESAIWQRR